MPHRTCLYCAKPYHEPHEKRRVEFCSIACKRLHNKKPCPQCGQSFDHGVGRFCSHRCKAQAWREANPGKSAGYVRKWKNKDPEHVRRLGREADMRRRTTKLLACKAWREANRERHISNVIAWQKRNPDKVKVYNTKKFHNRRAQKAKTNTVGDAKAYRAFVLHVRTAAVLSCYWCHKPTPKRKRQIDHIIPLARGGGDVVLNLCMSCATCNVSRKAKLPHEFSGQFELPFCA